MSRGEKLCFALLLLLNLLIFMLHKYHEQELSKYREQTENVEVSRK